MHRFTLLSSLFSLLNFVLCPVLYQGDGNQREETVAFPLARIGEFREDSIVEEGDKAGNGIGSRNVRIFLRTSVQPSRLHRVRSVREKRGDPRFVSSNWTVNKNRFPLFQRKWKPCETESFVGGGANEPRELILRGGPPFFLRSMSFCTCNNPRSKG